ncbi:hypothetical protein SAMN02745248_02419 [Hathewaya proteolytica DSM 3090]|uniref:Uncharacterized protein n=1 Tax=Hathewaya proteolytica DSM 3090 TaxID=1121331 RepID=A0A1M6S197_9CLOT|nr:hypothetical protein [Hathewaya proteolytica]SHK38453.1 hypothetical protein SAMN02745248_02419 [Hathewaya proteolytica DSM 3090]
MKDLIWFWKASKVYTKYNYMKLFFKWWRPLRKFMKLSKDDRIQFKKNSMKFL